MSFSRLLNIHQKFPDRRVADISSTVKQELASARFSRPQSPAAQTRNRILPPIRYPARHHLPALCELRALCVSFGLLVMCSPLPLRVPRPHGFCDGGSVNSPQPLPLAPISSSCGICDG